METNNLIYTRGQYLKNSIGKVPQKNEVYQFVNELIAYLFPILSNKDIGEEEKTIDEILLLLDKILKSYETDLANSELLVQKFKAALPQIYDLLTKDAVAIYEGDPAAQSVEEVIICYPGFYAILVYRIAHELANLAVPIIPRMLTEYSHSKTGIDIHAKARIGESFCIDHGTGIVIGETAEIGKSVKIYQGVTLGAISVSKEYAGKKRHPTIEDNTVIYAGSTILGGNTRIGHHSTIGGNVWLTHSVDPYSVVINQIKVHLSKTVPNKKESVELPI
ncbi:MAG: serine acetyltransferase [Bacteroidales bacterium]|nr:serine acetyltransferase [Bacteroidales bacterium]